MRLQAALLVLFLALGGPGAALAPVIDPDAALAASRTLPLGDLGRAGLEFARSAAMPNANPDALLATLPALLDAQSDAAATLVPGTRLHATATDAVEEARGLLAAIRARPAADAKEADVLAWALAMQPHPEPQHAEPAISDWARPSDALRAHFAYYGAPVRPDHAAAFAAMDHLARDQRDALVRLVAAHLYAAETTRIAFDGFRPVTEPVPVAQLPFDVGLLLRARDRVAAIVATEFPKLVPTASGGGAIVDECGVAYVNLVDEDNGLNCDYPLSIDVGGTDTYAFNSGGTMVSLPSALHIDGGGDDTYPCVKTSQGINGAANLGTGFLFDFGGNESYTATMLADGSVNGGARLGVGLFVDFGGDDTYAGVVNENGSFAGGSLNGVGTFIDLGGNDTHNPTFAGGTGAINGGALGGRGFLLDTDGNDDYLGTFPGDGVANGAGRGGVGVLLDLAGDDVHQASVGGDGVLQGAGLHQGTGILIDTAGNDSYKSTVTGRAAVNGAGLLGNGILIDTAGDWNEYLDPGATLQAMNGGAIGALADGDATPHPAGALGVLISHAPSVDLNLAHGVTSGAGHLYGLGVLVDGGGGDTYTATGNDAVAFGAGHAGGVGIWVDRGGLDVLTLTGGLGLARGSQGVGVVVRPNPASQVNVADYVPSSTFAATGGGLGAWLDNGTFVQQGQGPILGCARTPTVVMQPVGDYEVHVCRPDPDGGEAIFAPLTGEPVGPVPKAPVPCRTTVVLVVDCGAIVGSTLGGDAVDWLEHDEASSTLSGGLELLQWTPQFQSQMAGAVFEPTFADRICDMACSPSV